MGPALPRARRLRQHLGGADLGDLVIPPIDCDVSISLEDVLSHRVNGTPGTDFIYNPVVFGRLSNYVEEMMGRLARMGEAPPFRHVNRAVDDSGFQPSVLPNTELDASSGIIASARALARYRAALLRADILPRDLLERMWTPAPGADSAAEPYGLGWWIEQIEGRKVVWHGGSWPDAYAGMLPIVPAEPLVFVALGNTDGIDWGNPLDGAEIASSPLAATILDLFAP